MFYSEVACSHRQLSVSPQEVPLPEIARATEDTSPLEIQINEEINDGQLLHIKGTVTAKVYWEGKNAEVIVRGMREGEAVSSKEIPLATLLRGHNTTLLMEGEKIPFTIDIPSSQAKEYQLELVWGPEVAQATITPPERSIDGVHLENIGFQATPSARDGATVRYVVTGELVNSGPVRVVHISLGIGYLWVPHGSSLDLSAKLPENEEIVPLQEVTLDPSERRSLRLSLERDVPTSSLGEFHPVVRISDVSGE